MAVNNVVHVNEGGLPLNAVDWLVRHHQSKAQERLQMIHDLRLQPGSLIVDAGCGPGLWTPLLAQAIGLEGQILGIDIDSASLTTAQSRSNANWYRQQVHYKQATLEKIPADYGSVDVIFSANVSQYLDDPVATFAAMGPYLKCGGRLVIKDIDFGTLAFRGVDPSLQASIFQAREQWERVRSAHGYAFEDSWIGSKLSGYLRAAGYVDIEERTYRIVRHSPLSEDYRFYLQGIVEWFVSEESPYLAHHDMTCWLQSFFSTEQSVLNAEDFACEETEFVVSGVWQGMPVHSCADGRCVELD
jgi:Methylase involved in ubiquinone/menaquinone biosynthesis